MRTKIVFMLLTLLVFLSSNVSAKAGPDNKMMRGKKEPMMRGIHWWHNEKILEKLNLTEDQSEKINDLRMKTQKEMIKLGASLSEKMIDLKNEMTKEKLDEGKINSMMSDISKIQTSLWTARMQAYLDGAKILTPEQRKKIRSYLSDGPPHGPSPDMEK